MSIARDTEISTSAVAIGLEMLDREIGLTGKYPEKAAHIATAGEARVESERTVDQPYHGANVLAEVSQHEGGVGEDARVVLSRLWRRDGGPSSFLRHPGLAQSGKVSGLI